MLKNKTKFSNWINYIIKITPINFSKELLKTNLNKFWLNIVEKELKDNQHIIFLFRLQWSDNQFATIGNLQRLNIEDKDYIFNYILDEIKDKSDYYQEQSIISIVFTYAIREGKALEKSQTTKIQFHNYQHHKLPITMDPLEYGDLLYINGNDYVVQVNETNVAIISTEDGTNKVKLHRKAKLRYEYTDKILDNQTFIRTLGNKEWVFRNNEQLLYQVEKSAKFIQPLIRTETLQNKFLTLDIETFIKDGAHVPYAISIFDGENSLSYYLSDFKDSNTMLITAIKSIVCKKFDNFKVYIHNMSGFDGIFLLKILAEIGFVKPIIHNDKIISIIFWLNDYVITFRDSNQLLIGSLRKLANSFGIETQKGIFPYKFVNENNLNKFTKAELINKFKRLENKNSNSNQSIFTKIFSYILLFKNLILKITLFTFLIKWIRKIFIN